MLIAQIFSLFLSASDANCRELIFHREMEGRDGTTLSPLSRAPFFLSRTTPDPFPVNRRARAELARFLACFEAGREKREKKRRRKFVDPELTRPGTLLSSPVACSPRNFLNGAAIKTKISILGEHGEKTLMDNNGGSRPRATILRGPSNSLRFVWSSKVLASPSPSSFSSPPPPFPFSLSRDLAIGSCRYVTTRICEEEKKKKRKKSNEFWEMIVSFSSEGLVHLSRVRSSLFTGVYGRRRRGEESFDEFSALLLAWEEERRKRGVVVSLW